MIPIEDITGVILCGGEARRMGGVHKSLALAMGIPMVGHVRARLAPQVSRIIISANAEPVAHAAWGDEVVPDGLRGMGPLGGLLTAMNQVNTPYTFCCPCDAPLLSRTLVERLGERLLLTSADVAMPHDGEQPQQLFLLLRTSVRDSLRNYLSDGGRSVLGWTDTLPVALLDVQDDLASFLNVNTPEDLLRAVEMLTALEAAR
ncbi:MAG: molybdenum cofactor guanylyltransferase MobA [Gemmatimonadales bacterium]|nr:molybdenum cofactor guanylyltransferase MobA [Gemmatimonadales bacterium]